MSVGSKIKMLRKKQGLTQQELSDGIITHGMLSRIESETAFPSMQTLFALAQRLQISPGFLLDQGDDILPLERSRIIKAITEEYATGNLPECLEIFSLSGLKIDGETAGIYASCSFSVALQHFYAGDFLTAKTLLKDAANVLPMVLLPLRDVTDERITFLKNVMEHIDDLNQVIQDTPGSPDFGFPPSFFFFILKLLQTGRHDHARMFAEFSNPDLCYRKYIEAQIMIREYRFIDAILSIKAMIAEESLPVFFALLCYDSIEKCCKLCEDYKGAYENHIRYEELLRSIKR